MIQTYNRAIITANEHQWVMLYNEEAKTIILRPRQGGGTYTCVDTLVIADTLEECEKYISERELLYFEF